MKIAIYQTLVGGGGGNDAVLFSLLDKYKNDHVTLFCETLKIPVSCEVKELSPVHIPIFGIYQNLLRSKTPREFAKYDEIHVLTGTMVYNTTKTPMTYYNQNNFGDIIQDSKYSKGFWKIYYMPYKIMLARFKKKIIKSNVRFVSNSYYAAKKLKNDFGIDSTVAYPTIKKEYYTLDKKNKLITLSRFSQEKNMEFVLSVFDFFGGGKVYAHISYANVPYYKKITRNSKSTFHLNCERAEITESLAEAKVYFCGSVETFGIAVIEGIASGCIPIVPDNSAHPETVPFPELRYKPNSLDDAIKKIQDAIDGKFDHLLPELKNHVERFYQ
ncbi:MAG TPA: glycosyltransferase [Nitrosarchaeum sp.]|nr:glycosyltransferase [Nitrosarchaeum sp.]